MPMRIATLLLVLAGGCGGAAPAPQLDCDAAPLPAATARVGQRDGGALLPNGDGLAPAGERILVGQSPLHLAVAPGGQTVALAEFGVNQWGVEVLTVASGSPLQRPNAAPLFADSAPGGFMRGLAFRWPRETSMPFSPSMPRQGLRWAPFLPDGGRPRSL